ncbi:hypothetical protein FIT66_04490 [Candidatus Methylopumilus planktonicus]|uniref:hypothetical protein n=1 Tax=Candidatus Methylopumilus planktonicus TaxID=1581557 RepID=UPI00111F5864|nr:hypothetical protein [Candidatus Methylopumilus planktonicus]QDD07084.1 hypothetical protein FIT67_04490 [Candidatus Methylopumilus planktonicus]QDD08420.1 hypothetical protein FIT66_04490 [Candidatus Methylopumilus planktonicus]QDD09744.1 hypothetical protein FIT65_04510 [Candidatus Methylopumilus planktonicus]
MSVFANLPSHQVNLLVHASIFFSIYALLLLNKRGLIKVAGKVLPVLHNLNNIKPINNKFTIYFILISIFFCFDIPNIKYPYGTGNGEYADSIDSFSEYIVRGTIQKNIYHPNDYHPFLIPPKGYGNSGYDWKYYDDKYITQYRSNLGLQSAPFTFLAYILNIKSEKEFDSYFTILRKLNAISFALFITIFFYNFCKKKKYQNTSLIPIIVVLNSGFALYSQNLYFISAVYALPLAALSSELIKKNNYSFFSVLLCGFLVFLRGYEFATLFALLVAFICFYFKDGDLEKRLKSSIKGFFIIVLSFAIVTLLHIFLIWHYENFPISFMQAFETFTNPIKYRSLSLDGVPTPLSFGFFGHFYRVWLYDLGFSFFQFGNIKVGTDKNIGIPQIAILILYIHVFWSRIKKIDLDESSIFIYSFLGYISWYIFAYQHIMGHGGMYNYFIFSFSIMLGFSMLLISILNESKQSKIIK